MTSQKPYETFNSEEEAVAFAKKHRLKVVKGKGDLYFAGTWKEPMLATVYKPKKLADKMPRKRCLFPNPLDADTATAGWGIKGE